MIVSSDGSAWFAGDRREPDDEWWHELGEQPDLDQVHAEDGTWLGWVDDDGTFHSRCAAAAERVREASIELKNMIFMAGLPDASDTDRRWMVDAVAELAEVTSFAVRDANLQFGDADSDADGASS